MAPNLQPLPPMQCHRCQAEAVSRCYHCGALLCEEHGGKEDNCKRCTTAIAAGDPGGNRVSATPLGAQAKQGWWRPQQSQEYQPPACYACKGLTRAVCRNCENPYCRDHQGPSGLCADCGRSARFGMYVFVGTFVFILLFCLYHWLVGPS